MPRAPIGKRAMTPAERQQKRRKRRKRLKKEKLALGRKAERQRQLLKAADDYLPTPPGITYWRKVTVVTPQGERDVWSPEFATAAEHRDARPRRWQSCEPN